MELVGPVTFGRDPGLTVHLAAEDVSWLHATIRLDGATVVIEDAGSTNGTFVDGRRITGAVTLRGGETIAIGESRFEVEILDADAGRDAEATDPSAPAERRDTEVAARRSPRSTSRGVVQPPAVVACSTSPGTPRPPAAAAPFGTFAPAAVRPRRGVASRELVPSLVSFAAIVATAIALVAYFAERLS